jgi:hypothetical protein
MWGCATGGSRGSEIIIFTGDRLAAKRHAKAVDMGKSVERLLDAENTSVTLLTMGRAAAVLGKELTIGLRDAD